MFQLRWNSSLLKKGKNIVKDKFFDALLINKLFFIADGMTLAIVRDMSKANGIKSINNSDHFNQKMNNGTTNGTTTHNTTNGSSQQNGLSDSEVSNGNSAGSKLSKVSPVFLHSVWKLQKKSHSILRALRAKRATFTFWVEKRSLKMPKIVNFGEFLKLVVKQCYQTGHF